jgi:hypothetical protein
MYLKAMGKDAFVISTDDYFLEREDTPKKPDGTYEFECVEALDVKLFNTQMKALLDGKAVSMPTFNFITGKKEYKKPPVKLEKNQILVVEGLHAISEKLNHAIPKKNKLRVIIIGACMLLTILLLKVFGLNILTKTQLSRFTFLEPCTRYQDATGFQVCNGYIAINNGKLISISPGNSMKSIYIYQKHIQTLYSQ